MKNLIVKSVLGMMAAAMLLAGAHICTAPVAEDAPVSLCILDFVEVSY